MCPEGAEGDDALRGKGRCPDLSLPTSSGVYAICLSLEGPVKVLSRGGRVLATVGPGLILYVGSAGGRGGLRARVTRHLRGPRSRWWHIDSITSSGLARSMFIYYEVGAYGPPAEDGLARYLLSRADLEPLGRLGATDSSEPHMFKCANLESVIRALRDRGGQLVKLDES